MPEKKPTDHQSKAEGYTFTHKGKRYTLPDFTEQRGRIPGGVVMDALMDPNSELAEVRLALSALQVSNVPAKTMAALREMPADDMFTIVGEWMGETGGSSD